MSNELPPDIGACVAEVKAVKPSACVSVVTQIAPSSGIAASPSLLA
jgi:hypothetical protein